MSACINIQKIHRKRQFMHKDFNKMQKIYQNYLTKGERRYRMGEKRRREGGDVRRQEEIER